MSVTFYDNGEAEEYKRKKAEEGLEVKLQKYGNEYYATIVKEISPMQQHDSPHKEFPLSTDRLNDIISDIRNLYPEADKISIVGTYARTNESPSEKKHDVDLLIHFPENIDKQEIVKRRDDNLWNKYSKDNLDFLIRVGDEVTNYGQHQYRLDSGLSTPEVKVWSK